MGKIQHCYPLDHWTLENVLKGMPALKTLNLNVVGENVIADLAFPWQDLPLLVKHLKSLGLKLELLLPPQNENGSFNKQEGDDVVKKFNYILKRVEKSQCVLSLDLRLILKKSDPGRVGILLPTNLRHLEICDASEYLNKDYKRVSLVNEVFSWGRWTRMLASFRLWSDLEGGNYSLRSLPRFAFWDSLREFSYQFEYFDRSYDTSETYAREVDLLIVASRVTHLKKLSIQYPGPRNRYKKEAFAHHFSNLERLVSDSS